MDCDPIGGGFDSPQVPDIKYLDNLTENVYKKGDRMTELQTLILDQGFQPLKVVSWKRAIELLTLGKIEILESYDEEVRSAFLVIKVPAVARLIRHFRRVKKPVKFSRISVYGRDNYSCLYCNNNFSISELTYDHVIPRSQNGKTNWENIATCCVKCNSKKSGRTPEQAGMKLRYKPYQPTATPNTVIQLSRKSIPDAWRDWVYWNGELDSDG